LKWFWFYSDKSRDAVDFEIFDKASRGAWGSFLLLCHTKGRSLAALGAILTLLLLTIDTFFQQLTDLPVRWTLHGTALIPRTIRYEPQYVPEFLYGVEAGQTDQNILAVANTFFIANGTQSVSFGNGTRPDVPLSCPTSSCTWPPYETLGMCSQCSEVSQLLTFACLETRIDWTSNLNSSVESYPNATACGYFLNATSKNPTMMSGYLVAENGQPEGETLVMRTLPLISNPLRIPLWGGSINFKDTRDPIVDVLISSTVSRSQVRANEAPTLHECVLTWCVKTIESSYQLGAYQENVKIIYNSKTAVGTPWSTFTYNNGDTDMVYLENVTISAPATEAKFTDLGWGVSNITMISTTMIFDQMFPAFTTVAHDSLDGLLRWRLGHPTQVRTRLLKMNPWLLPNNVTRHFERLATALTNVIRSDPDSHGFVAGKAFVAETYVAVHWAWFTFPLAMLCLSIIFLVATIVKTSKSANGDIGIWKTSAMPTLNYSLPQSMRHDLTSLSTWRSTPKNGAKTVRIRLIPNQGWRVSGQICTPASPSMLRRSGSQTAPGWV
jgi:hypothetical protein